jgi:phosphate starvation-inducible membrane PsiE
MLCLFFASAAIDLLKQLKEKDEMSTYMVVDQVFFYCSFWALGSLMASDFRSLIKITRVLC